MDDVKITYLLGAGASAQSLPTIDKMQEHFNLFLKFMQLLKEQSKMSELKIQVYTRQLEKARKYLSIDAYMRNLWLQNSQHATNEYKEMKRFLCLFFIFEQSFNDLVNGYSLDLNEMKTISTDSERILSTSIDPRYFSFFGNLIDYDEERKLNNRIGIISWNYDSQIELALNSFWPNTYALDTIKDKYKIGYKDSLEIDSMIIKLNGVANFLKDKTFQHFEIGIALENDIEDFVELLNDSKRIESSEYLHNLIFAWESVSEMPHVTKSTQILQETDVLVIIGYSFPDFNRAIDKRLINECKATRVYVQGPKNEVLIQKIKSFKNEWRNNANAVVEIEDISQFYIPMEYYMDRKEFTDLEIELGLRKKKRITINRI